MEVIIVFLCLIILVFVGVPLILGYLGIHNLISVPFHSLAGFISSIYGPISLVLLMISIASIGLALLSLIGRNTRKSAKGYIDISGYFLSAVFFVYWFVVNQADSYKQGVGFLQVLDTLIQIIIFGVMIAVVFLIYKDVWEAAYFAAPRIGRLFRGKSK